jgi:DNA-binding IclR family transcriptional regulator
LAWQPYPGLLSAARLPLHQLATTTNRSAALLVTRAQQVVIAAASIVRQDDAAVLRPGSVLPTGTMWQRDLGVILVTAPVHASDNQLIGTVGLLLPVDRSSDSRAEAVRRAARAIRSALLR